MESGWNVWVWLVGVVSRKWVWLVGVGGMYLVGVIVRRYIDFLILLIPTPLVSVLFCSSIFNVFRSYMYLHCKLPNKEENSISKEPGVVNSSNESFTPMTICRRMSPDIIKRTPLCFLFYSIFMKIVNIYATKTKCLFIMQ